ncbi:MAG: GTPase domain-containing protein [Granulosicoccus sp.]|nr:GTPase domain-containing protein [Granulosicoccus sp.]
MRLLHGFRGTTRSALWYLSLVVVVPLITLSLLGLVYLWQSDRLLIVLTGWLGITLAGYGVFIAWPQLTGKTRDPGASADRGQAADSPETGTAGRNVAEQLPDNLEEASDWTEQDRAVWREMRQHVETRLAGELSWKALPDESLRLLSAVSAHYNPHLVPATGKARETSRLEYRFTLPEALLVLSVASERYRNVILQHIPFAERVTVASLVTLYGRQRDIQKGYTWLNNVRRTVRLVNPLAAVVGEIRDQFTNRVFDHLSATMQRDLKRLLLQEVVQVGIDLYSGKLKTSASELQHYRSGAYARDMLQKAPLTEPLRILLVGQTSAGKSSLINALASTLSAEVDILPTTDSTVIHSLQLDDAAPMHLIDTVGLTGKKTDDQAALTHLVIDADMILLIVRANQPARAPDQSAWEALQQVFVDMPRRRPPPLMLIMTHIDQLSPKASWSPPYDLGGEDVKALNISKALRSALSQIGLPAHVPAVPVCLSAEKGFYNVEAVAAQLMLLQDSATLTQLNRRRQERGEQAIGWRERWGQVKRLGLVLGRAATGNAAPDEPPD